MGGNGDIKFYFEGKEIESLSSIEYPSKSIHEIEITPLELTKLGFDLISDEDEVERYSNGMIIIERTPEMSCYWQDSKEQTPPLRWVSQIKALVNNHN